MKIASVLGLTELPSAFQARLGSAKGMWIIDGDPSSGDDIWIVTYPSQRKWDCDNEDIHHRTFEVLEWSKEPRSASLNQQFIPVLEAQAIKPFRMRTVIAAHLARGLLEDFAAQETAMEDPVELRLWLQQGIGSKSGGNEDTVLFQGALPRELEKRAAVLLDSGFHPKTCKFLQDQCRAMAKQRADFLKDKMNICVPCSAYLLMVVDFSSTLEEDEVHVSFSTKFKVDGFCDTLLEGMDVLVARAPSHLPSDIQRVKVVSKPQLRQLKDVVVFSTKGRSSLADKLSGGDYDGDRAWVCWDQDIVQNFRNAAMPEDDTDPVKLGYIHKLERSMAQIRKEETNEDSVCAKFLYEAFSFNMEPSLLGICTDYKERYSYYLGDVGNNNKNILILSRALGCLVDQPKQGYIFSFLDWDQFRKALHMPRYLPEPDYKLPRPTNEFPKRAPLHILDYLRHRVAEDTTNNALTAFNKLLDSYQAHSYDVHLTKLFNDIDERNRTNTTWVRIRKVLNEDIESVRDLWSTQFIREMGGGDFVNAVEPIYRKWCQIQPLATERSSDLAQYLLQPWMINRQSTLWELLKASYTFKKFHTSQAFTWQIAGRQLAMLKPFMSHGSTANACILVVPQLYSVLKPDKKVIAARRVQRLAKTDMAHVSANHLQARGFGHDNADIDEEEDM
ncbi:hypothetical protein ED733_000616 [Metarhizium rileyi]|uniref:RNA-dependent RNA polymerase n=1 Tax=Metarhizium rileyi (strain RCEF 4871) TaxID=1649241 RepID=A0A5C6GHT3_METRR|nr:hypothetical protein ED733_000616 [Metarhizium rileyi]